ncbi:hypothetical protein ACFVFS_40475 [Kitasatospora sp. NPDC057692]|uniref:hypothetical protein n=1 Tax=Kitasatospora sp. NPDC057692 TaxID=3346215 RepID=UPI0036C26EF3
MSAPDDRSAHRNSTGTTGTTGHRLHHAWTAGPGRGAALPGPGCGCVRPAGAPSAPGFTDVEGADPAPEPPARARRSPNRTGCRTPAASRSSRRAAARSAVTTPRARPDGLFAAFGPVDAREPAVPTVNGRPAVSTRLPLTRG